MSGEFSAVERLRVAEKLTRIGDDPDIQKWFANREKTLFEALLTATTDTLRTELIADVKATRALLVHLRGSKETVRHTTQTLKRLETTNG